MKRTHKLVIGAVAGLGLGLATFANANPGFGPGPGFGHGCMQEHGGGPGMGQGFGPGMGMGRGAGFGNPQAMTEGHLAWLKAELKIAPAQEAVWKTFSDQKRQQAEAMQSWAKSMQEKAPATAPERMEARNQWAKKRIEQGEQMTTSFKTLYAALTAEQKAMLDKGLMESGPGFHGGPGGRFR